MRELRRSMKKWQVQLFANGELDEEAYLTDGQIKEVAKLIRRLVKEQ
jgi:hypothetical protein